MKSLHIHLGWLLFISLLIILALVVRTPLASLILDYTSFASSVISILLALIAIIYGFVSGQAFHSVLGQIKATSERISAETLALHGASKGLSAEAEEIVRKLGVLPDKFTTLQGEIGKKLEDLTELRQNSVAEDNSGKFSGRSNAFTFATYIIARSFLENESFDLDDMFEGSNYYGPRWYIQGIVEMFVTFNIADVHLEGIESKYQTISMGSLNADDIVQNARGSLPDNKGNLMELFDFIDQYFDNKE